MTLEILDADMHVRDLESHLRRYLPPEFARRERLIPHDNFDRRLGNRLGKENVDGETQLRDMDVEGIVTAVLYPTNGLSIGEIREVAFSRALARAYNEWITEYCQRDPRRLKAVALLPVENGEVAAAELEYAVQHLGLVGGMLPSYIRVGPRNVGSRLLDPLYAAAESLNVPIAIHASGGLTPINERMDSFVAVHTFSHVPEQMAALTAAIFGGVLERFPRLRLGFMEASCGWVPFWSHHMDEEFEMRHEELPDLQAKPGEYLARKQCYFGVEGEDPYLPEAVRVLGDEVLLWASDYPHWDSSWPHSAALLLNRTDISEEQKTKIVGGNCRKFYGLHN